jgi:EpsI family protein
MNNKLSNYRIGIVLALFALTFAGLQYSQVVKETPITQPLSGFPLEIGDWKFARKTLMDAPIINLLGVNDYISYDYVNGGKYAVNLYVSYFTAVGVTGSYHSPQNCLPGGGWKIASVETVPLTSAPASFKGNEILKVIVQQGTEQQVVLYWFQNRGRIISDEYWEKIYLVLDAVFKQRRDGSFIRIIGQVPKGADRAQFEKEMLDFAGKTVEAAAKFIPGA